MCIMRGIASFLGNSFFRRSHLHNLHFPIDIKFAWLVEVWATVVHLRRWILLICCVYRHLQSVRRYAYDGRIFSFRHKATIPSLLVII